MKTKNNKNNFYKFYYLLLGGFLLTQVSYTLYQASFVVAHGRQQQNLKLHQAQLTYQKQKLEEKLAINTSLSMFTQKTGLVNYQAISQPLTIETSNSLAALN
ncbi:hypothetical protein KKE34_01040 [Patescibacteria group bacterium]|nr:hypothetical protein [Patescibacteria group bacterium]MBU1885176.1 hypothetical protein [Patescibacteria group bacterium]